MNTSGVDLGQMFREHGPFVWQTLRRMGLSEADADDVSQEVFVVVCRKLEGFEERSSLTTWLYGICFRLAIAHRRRAVQREIPTAEPVGDDVIAPHRPDEGYEANEARALLDAALERLDPDKREVFVMFAIEERPMTEIVDRLGCPLQTAYSRLYAARAIVEAHVLRATRAPRPPEEKRMATLAASLLARIDRDGDATDPGIDAGAAAAAGGGWAAVGGALAVAVTTAAIVWGLTTGRPSPRLPPAFVASTTITATTTTSITTTPATTMAASASAAAITTAAPSGLSPSPRAKPPAMPASAPSTIDDPAAEAALLRRAQTELRTDPQRALATCDAHARQFRPATLAQEREVVAIDALVRLGRHDEAKARAARFFSTFPGSGHRPRIEALVGP